MTFMTVTEAKAKLTSLVQGMQKHGEEVVVTRSGKPAAVILGYEDFESLKATMEILGDEDAMRQIRAFQKEEREGTVRWHDWEDIKKEMDEEDKVVRKKKAKK